MYSHLSRRRLPGHPRAVVFLAAAAMLVAVVPSPAVAVPAGPHPGIAAAPQTAQAGGFSVTLVTGDRVHLTPLPGGRHAVDARPAAGRRVSFATRRTSAGLEVIPSDAVRLLAADRLDRRLFDVLLLRRLGYHDEARTDLPILISGSRDLQAASGRSAPRLPTARPGAREVRRLPSLGIRSLRVSKANARAFWTATTAASTTAARTGEKTWLVGARTLTLDRSVRQIGAPTTWKRGLTGKGVRIAVLDSGYDPKHPDLKGAVRVAKDFTGSKAGIKDTVGHGTHVASTVAGRGVASRGRFRGVAPAATLAIGKVCPDLSCSEDAILAGMDWAATTARARVVNLSLGGPVGDGPDPLEQAVERLTATTGALFVISAGNEGPDAETVGSPSTAPSALSVASVGRTDVLSRFSSRGPHVYGDRTGDYALKPEIAAPGEAIVAARAAGTLNGEAVPGHGGKYAALSGTSMAAPHVAGAAAVLAQQHPTWRSAQLKAALTATAQPLASGTVFEQGAGRVDLARAASSPVTVSAGVLHLGYFPWPNADPPAVTRTVTYRNTGRRPVTLRLAATLSAPDGSPASPEALTLDRQRLTIAPGRSAAVAVTYRAARGPVGAVSGRITAVATDGTPVVHTTLGAYREPESYNLTLKAFDRTGGSATALVSVVERRTGRVSFLDVFGRSRVHRLPAGEYTVVGLVDESSELAWTVSAQDLRLDRTRELVLDARRGNQVTFTVPRADAVQESATFFVEQSAPSGGLGVSGMITDGGRMFLVPGEAPIPGLTSGFTASLVRPGPRSGPATPWIYHVAQGGGDRLPADPVYRFTAADFAEIRQTYAFQGAKEWRYTDTAAWFPGASTAWFRAYPLGRRTQRTEYVAGSSGVTWQRGTLSLYNGDDPTTPRRSCWHLRRRSRRGRFTATPGTPRCSARCGPRRRAGTSSETATAWSVWCRCVAMRPATRASGRPAGTRASSGTGDRCGGARTQERWTLSSRPPPGATGSRRPPRSPCPGPRSRRARRSRGGSGRRRSAPANRSRCRWPSCASPRPSTR
jgi:subtilisin family serine protease